MLSAVLGIPSSFISVRPRALFTQEHVLFLKSWENWPAGLWTAVQDSAGTFSAERSIDFFPIKIWWSRSDLQRQFLHLEQIKADDSKLEKASQRAAARPRGPVYLATSTYDVKKNRQFGEGRDFLALII